MRLRVWIAAVVAFAVSGSFAPSLASAQVAPPPPQGAYVPQPGMQFEGTLVQSLTSRDAWVGEQVALINVNSTDQLIAGARMYGRVIDVKHAGQGSNAEVLLRFDTLQLANGTLYPVVGEVTHVTVKTANNGAKEALGALGGMIVGNILGKWFGTNLGGVVGAAGGYLVAKNSREDVTIPADSVVAVRLVPPHPQQPIAAPYPPYPTATAPMAPAQPIPSYAQPPPPPSAPPAPPAPAPPQGGPPGPAPTPQPD